MLFSGRQNKILELWVVELAPTFNKRSLDWVVFMVPVHVLNREYRNV